MKRHTLLIGIFLVFSLNCLGQVSRLFLSNGDSLTTKIIGVSDTQLLIKNRSFSWNEIDSVAFADKDITYQSVYDRIQAKTKVIFGYNLPVPKSLKSYYITKHADYVDGLPINEDGILRVDQVIQMPGLSSLELYNRSKLFFVETFNSANHVIQLDDAENKVIIGKGGSTFKFTIKIQARDGRYKYEIYDISISGLESSSESPLKYLSKVEYFKKNGSKKAYPEIVFKLVQSSLLLLEGSIQFYMSQPFTDGEEDW